ncbi:MAG: hypothetical protein M3T56_09930 [Chloroflexota bacterium]|nr:hypothetical protein [Chloroflexota bacterium]
MEPGLYVTFFKEGESREGELPPVGPLEHVVLRDGVLVADRKSVHHVDISEHANAGRWIDAELELQRAMGVEPGGARRPHLRFAAREGVYLRFASFGESAENNPARELGPYAVVTVGPRGVDADGELLAIPTGSKRALWDLTATAGKDLAGVVRPDIAFRTQWTAYHGGIRPPRTEPATPTKSAATESALRSPVVPPALRVPERKQAFTVAPARPQSDPPPRPMPTVATRSIESPGGGASRGVVTAKATAPANLQYADPVASTLLSRVSANPRTTTITDAGGGQSSRGLEWGGALWGMRFVIIGVLVIFVAVFGFVSVRNNVNAPSVSTVAIGKTITGVRWDYTVNNVSRTTTAGEATSRDIYLVVRVGVKNRGSEGAVLAPGEFSLVDSTGTEYASLSQSAAPYQSPANSGSPYVWPRDYPVGQLISLPVFFEIPQSVRGLQLLIREVPTTRVKLD